MPSIGAPLRKWTLLLLLCSTTTSAVAQAANETATTASDATASTSTTSRPSSTTPASPSTSSTRRYANTDTACPFRTINYITHTLPQQCAKTSWSAPSEVAPTDATDAAADATPNLLISVSEIVDGAESSAEEGKTSTASTGASQVAEPDAVGTPPSSGTVHVEPDVELETDSPFDNANFLSFEEWKNKNLAQVGQSPENVGQGRAAASNQPARRRPVNVNALDSLGDEGEIELDFSGFGAPAAGEHIASDSHRERHDKVATKSTNEEGKVAPSSWARSKDAGKTCKERFNYASFDCAATVLKTNKQAKSSSSILVENKDSYMLNQCSADNKFLIVELCDDILVDTLVLANYEFFSSMFRHFRVSVSDRYPVKMERWRTLGTFEARNSRDIQPFLITEPQIWARYLRVEFLTQFGNEFYCPLSLLRVHGTTMMEQFRREEEEARGGDDDDGDLEAEVDVVKPAVDSGPLLPEQLPVEAVKDASVDVKDESGTRIPIQSRSTTDIDVESTRVEQQPGGTGPSSQLSTTAASPSAPTDSPEGEGCSNATSISSLTLSVPLGSNSSNITAAHSTETLESSSSTDRAVLSSTNQRSDAATAVATSSSIVVRDNAAASSVANAISSPPTSTPPAKASSNSTVASAPAQSQSRGLPAQSTAPTPPTQESFFKSIHKRLLYLEANSTLSLQYIEEQSRILRDAFVKVEKRQLAKTEKFLDHLNSTVMQELKGFRNMYDQLWQSTVIELESMKERQKSEMGEIGVRLSLMADELVWQKRMAVVQSTLLLLCLGLVLFVRSGTLSAAADVPIVQQLGSKYTSFFETSPTRSPEPPMVRRRRTLRNMWRSDTSVGLSDHQSDGQQAISDAETDGARSPVQIEYIPPTPDSSDIRHSQDESSSPHLNGIDTSPLPDEDSDPASSPDDQAARIQVLETQSGPATPNGTRDSRPSWEEVDRAIDQLKAEEQGLPVSQSTKRDRERKKRRSPLRRTHSSYDGAADNSPADDSGDDLFVS